MVGEKKPIQKGDILCDSKYMTFWKRQNSEDTKNPGLERGEEWLARTQKTFRAGRLLCIIHWWVYVIILTSKTVESTTPSRNPNVNHRIWMTVMFQYRLINRNKWTTLVQHVYSGAGWVFVGLNTWELRNICSILLWT